MTALANRSAAARLTRRRGARSTRRRANSPRAIERLGVSNYQGTTVEYAARRFRTNISFFNALAGDVEAGD